MVTLANAAPRSVWATTALFALGAAAVVGARPAGRGAVRALLFPSRASVSAQRAAGPLRSSASAQSVAEPTATPAPLPQRWSARAPTDRAVFAIEERGAARGDAGDAGAPALLRSFFERLASLERAERAIVRVAHIGDSIVADDKITRRLRQRLQQEFGDAGLGWLYAQRPTRWYHPRGVRYDASGFALTSVVDARSEDARYGAGAAAFDARTSGAIATVTVPSATRATVYALADRAVSVRFDGGAWSALVDGVASAQLAAGAHTINLRAESQGSRLFGLSVESGARGVIVDNLGLVGSSARSLSHQDPAHWEQSLRSLSLDLAVISLGTNDSSHGPIWPAQRPQLEEDHAQLYALAKRVAGACLVLLPPDSAEERGGPLGTRVALPVILEAQRRAAERAGCAVWDTWRWMGGRNAIVRWRSLGLADGDYTHLTDAGAARIADAVADALLSARDAFVARAATASDGGSNARDR
jgi:lysophospholipase L1-like esterase